MGRFCCSSNSTASIPRNKPRLMLALYARPKHPDSHHYALLITPKPTSDNHQSGVSATKFHALNTLQVVSGEAAQPWRFERTTIADLNDERRLLVCVIIAKILDEAAVARTLEAVPVYQCDDPDQGKAQGFDCVAWASEALDQLRHSRAVASLPPFDEIEQHAIAYVARKKREGRWSEPAGLGVPMFDLLQGRQIVP